jgi:hypothetical protein
MQSSKKQPNRHSNICNIGKGWKSKRFTRFLLSRISSNKGSNQSVLHSQCESKKTNTLPVAALAPAIEIISHEVKTTSPGKNIMKNLKYQGIHSIMYVTDRCYNNGIDIWYGQGAPMGKWLSHPTNKRQVPGSILGHIADESPFSLGKISFY